LEERTEGRPVPIAARRCEERVAFCSVEDGIMSIRPVRRISRSTPAIEGAGVHLHRAFGFGATAEFDPFLLFDDFRNDDPAHYKAGFPWHPHRGIETITYVLAGEVEHADSIGNRGAIRAGDIQWMTAGRGILHQEMPRGAADGRMHGFQLWANLPSSQKMTAPRYQEIASAEIPEVIDDDGTRVRVVSGDMWGRRGPVEGIAAEATYLDVFVPPGVKKSLPIDATRHAFAYVFEGDAKFADASDPLPAPTESAAPVPAAGTPGESGTAAGPSAAAHALSADASVADDRSLVLFDAGHEIRVQAGDRGVRFLLVSGRPLREPVAWYGPVVMNTQDELRQAYRELREGTFLR